MEKNRSGLPMYVFEDDTYAGFNGSTNENGQVSFTLPEGNYHFRTDLHGHSYWSEETAACAVPGCETAAITVPRFGEVTVTVQYRDGEVQAGLPVYAFNGSTYSGISGSTGEDGKVKLLLPEGEYRFRADFLGLQFWSAAENHSPEGDTCAPPECQHSTIETYATGENPYLNQSITYTYDGLYRLTDADYESGLYFRYQYDAVGREALPSETREHRLSESKLLGTEVPEIVNQYQYDETNRLISKNGTNYTWDANGNLLSDGESDYTYDSANLLVSVTKGETISQYGYNGLGDRVLQTINGLTTNYVLDLNSGLTQVLQDGTNTYLYGINRVAQSTAEQSEFFLADALGSVRTLSNPLAEITLTQSYTPFGEVLNTSGAGQTDYAFTGEMYDPNTGLVFLRARYYAASDGRFTSRDVWEGDELVPMSYNNWLYVYGNPISYRDETGLIPRKSVTEDNITTLCKSLSWSNSVFRPKDFQLDMCKMLYDDMYNKDDPTNIYNWYDRLFSKYSNGVFKYPSMLGKHFLSNEGTDLQMPDEFGRSIMNLRRVRRSLKDHKNWYLNIYVRPLVEMNVERDFSHKFIDGSIRIKGISQSLNPNIYFAWNQFKIDVAYSGFFEKKPLTNGYQITIEANYRAFDTYNWHTGLTIDTHLYGHIPDDWAEYLEFKGCASSFDSYYEWSESENFEINGDKWPLYTNDWSKDNVLD